MIKIDDFKVPWVKNTIMLYIGLSMVIKENMQQAVASLRVRHLPAGFFFFFFLDLSSEGVDKTFSMFWVVFQTVYRDNLFYPKKTYLWTATWNKKL